jgi:FkbM family methyltransferase
LVFHVHRRDVIGRHITKYGGHETALTQWIARRLSAPPSGLFVDVGANMGWHVLHAARHPAVESVVAFEPDAFNAWLLDQNLSYNGVGNVVVCCCAVGAAPGVAKLHRFKASNLGRHSVIADSGLGSRLTPLVDLDGALANLGFGERRVVMLKIDVEGYEPAVIEGARLTLARTDVVILEHSPDLSRAGGLSPAIVVDRLTAHGFASFVLGDDGNLLAYDAGRLETITGQMDVIWIRK